MYNMYTYMYIILYEGGYNYGISDVHVYNYTCMCGEDPINYTVFSTKQRSKLHIQYLNTSSHINCIHVASMYCVCGTLFLINYIR